MLTRDAIEECVQTITKEIYGINVRKNFIKHTDKELKNELTRLNSVRKTISNQRQHEGNHK